VLGFIEIFRVRRRTSISTGVVCSTGHDLRDAEIDAPGGGGRGSHEVHHDHTQGLAFPLRESVKRIVQFVGQPNRYQGVCFAFMADSKQTL
jgi:hypothetical protein